jgi:hypothetical protein
LAGLEGKRAKGGEAVYAHLEELGKVVSSRPRKRGIAGPMVALELDFVARPDGSRELDRELARVLEDARLRDEGLEASLLLVSDREARLVSLLTFWDRSRFVKARECRIAWIEKLLEPFADGSIRAHTSLPRFLAADARGAAVAQLGFEEPKPARGAAVPAIA